MSDQGLGSRRSTSSSILYTPSATPSVIFGEERASSPSFSFDIARSQVPEPSARTSSLSSNTTSSTPRYTPASTPSFNFGEQRSSAEKDSLPSASTIRHDADLDLDPDTPLPSVERDAVSPNTSRDSTPSLNAYTPSTPTRTSSNSIEGILSDDILNLRLNSSTPLATTEESSRPSYQRGTSSTTSAPSIHITPTVSPVNSRSNTTDRLVHGISTLRMDNAPHSPRLPDTDRLMGTPSPAVPGTGENANRSPSPSRRRRSGSGAGPIIHRVEDEDVPQALSREREVQETLTNARGVTARLSRALSSSALHQEQGSNIQSLHQQAIKLSEFQVPSSRIVGLVGDSGVGKSSLINSLLDKESLARASNSGEACTCVVTEYRFHDRDDFIIHVDYFTLEELRTQFEDLLQAYREYKSLTPGSDVTPEEREERENLKKKADLASSTFTSSFKDRLAQISEILLSLPFGHALDTMMDWTSQILSQQGNTKMSFGLIEHCSSRLNRLTSETDDSAHTSVWPFIRKIRVYLKAHILSKGLIIADLPGLRDLNSARQIITERYVRQCHQIFAVAGIGRVTTDQGVKEVFELARRAALSNVGVICTKSDDIEASEARADWPAERTRIDEMQKAVGNAKREVDLLAVEMHEFHGIANLCEEDKEDFMELQKEHMSADNSLKKHEFKLLHHTVTIRNSKVSRRLRTNYNNHPAGRDLHTFCVSNKLYWKLRGSPLSVSLPLLQLSGIIELRRYCIGIVAESHLRATTEYIRDQIPALFGSVELWVQAGSGNASAERKQQILEAMSAVQQQLDELTSPVSRISDISHSVNVNFDNRVRTYMRAHAAQWSASASEASMIWQSWFQSSFSAFCRNYGDHYTNAIGSCCWNEEAIAMMKDDMSDRWETFNDDIGSYLDRTNEFIETIFGNAIKIIMETANNQEGMRAVLHTLTATFRHRRGLLLYEVENIIDDFQSEMISIHTNGLSPIRTSIIGELMENTYKAANREHGSGSDRRRKAIITEGFSSPTLFKDHRRRFKKQFMEISGEFEEKIHDAITRQLAFIEADLNTLRDQNVVLESERNPDFRRNLAVELEAVKHMMTSVSRAMDDVTNMARDYTLAPPSGLSSS